MNGQDLLKKFLEGNCTREELARLYESLRQAQEEEYDELMEEVWNEMNTTDGLSAANSDKVLENVRKDIRFSQASAKRHKKNWPFYSLAAALIILILSTIVLIRHNPMVEIRTTYQQTQSIVLPDSTEIILNANSSLRYAEDFLSQASRDIWIDGEAYFHVRSLKNKAGKKVPFIVHTDVLDIQVTGTQFNVKDRHGESEIVLEEGSIRLVPQDQLGQALDMLPGQKVMADAASGLQLSQVEDPALYASWKENELYFEHQPLADIAQEIEDEYGLDIIIADPDLGNLQFTGSAPADQLEVLLISIEKSFNLNIQKDENRYIIEKAAQP